MNVLVDTSVWSLALRRAKQVDVKASRELAELIREGRVVIIGSVRQELLSGIKINLQLERLREHLRSFPDLELDAADYEEAAAAFNRCRERGIQGSNADFLLCAAAARRKLAIYTTDGDFRQYAKTLKLVLHEPRTYGSHGSKINMNPKISPPRMTAIAAATTAIALRPRALSVARM